MDIFSFLPVDIALDDRLTKTQLRVLIALYSFRSKNTDQAWPSRKKLSERCGIPEYRISTTTTELAELGWLTKEGNGGRSMSCRYRLTIPAMFDDSETVTKPDTVSKPETVSKPDTKTVSKPDTRKEHAIEHAKKDDAPRIMSCKDLQDEGISKEVASAYLHIRKQKKAPLTLVAWTGYKREAEKAGWTLEAAMRKCVERNWQGFSAEWVKGEQPPDQAHPAKPWFESWSGIVAKGAEYGLSWEEAQAKGVHESRFKARVFQLAGHTE